MDESMIGLMACPFCVLTYTMGNVLVGTAAHTPLCTISQQTTNNTIRFILSNKISVQNYNIFCIYANFERKIFLTLA